jgi:response regulator RpfG family c-di-GMP phosphodiesterase
VRVLVVDDDAGLRALLRATLDAFDVEIDEAENATVAETLLSNEPDAIVLDVAMPGGINGIEFCKHLKDDATTAEIPVVLLTGSSEHRENSNADAFLTKPFSPLELLAVVERLVGGLYGIPFRATKRSSEDEQLLLYARDLRHLLGLERAQRAAIQEAYRETVTALASALESKDTGTRQHSQRVQFYAIALARAIEPDLLDDGSAEYGFLLHDVGKIGIPDAILRKPGKLTRDERALMQTHSVLGEQMLSGVASLRGACLEIVRSHHERWDGQGYPDALSGDKIPIGARIFAVADAVDAITSDRPYRAARPWRDAASEIVRQRGGQFDPDVVDAFRERDSELREIHRELAAA